MTTAAWTTGGELIDKILKADTNKPKLVLLIDEQIEDKDQLRGAAYNALHKYSYELHPEVAANNDRKQDKDKAWKSSLKAARQLDVDVDSFQDEPDEDDRLKVYSFTPSGRVVEADPSSMDVDSEVDLDEVDLEIRRDVYRAAEGVLSQHTTTPLDARIATFRRNVDNVNSRIMEHNRQRGRVVTTLLVDPEYLIACFKDLERLAGKAGPDQQQEMLQTTEHLQTYCEKHRLEGDWGVAEIVDEGNPSAPLAAQSVPAASSAAVTPSVPTSMAKPSPTTNGRVPIDGVDYEVIGVQSLARNRGRVLLRAQGENNRFRHCLLAASEAVGKGGVDSCKQAGIPELSFGRASDLAGYSGLNLPPCEGIAEIVTEDRRQRPEKFSKRPVTICLLFISTKGSLWFRREDALAQFKKALDGLEQAFLAEAGQPSWTGRRAQVSPRDLLTLSQSSSSAITPMEMQSGGSGGSKTAVSHSPIGTQVKSEGIPGTPPMTDLAEVLKGLSEAMSNMQSQLNALSKQGSQSS